MTNSPQEVEELRSLSVKDVAELTGINRKTLDTWRSKERGTGERIGPPWFKAGGVVLYPLNELRQWVEQMKAAAYV